MVTGMIDLTNIRNIILDLGGVILELDVDRTVMEFNALGFPRGKNIEAILSKHTFFLEFETGKISTDEFISKLMEIHENKVSQENVIKAWNAMIRGFKADNIKLLQKLRKNYRLFLLSNTNAIHETLYNNQLKEDHGIDNLDRIFDKVYYSHDLKMRKPDPEIFRFVLDDQQFPPEECLFVDDTLMHVESARSVGIRAYHLASPERITDVL